MKALTARQRSVLDFIAECIGSDGYPPTIRQIGQKLGITTTCVHEHLVRLERKGWIVRDWSSSRAIRLTKSETCPMCGGSSNAA